MRDRKGPLAAMLLLSGYVAALLWAQIAFAQALGAPVAVPASPVLIELMRVNAWLLGWRLLMRASCTTVVHGWGEGLRSVPRTIVANLIAILATRRALSIHSAGGPRRWDKTHHVYPVEASQS